MEKIINFKCLNINANVKLDFRKKEVQISFNKGKKIQVNRRNVVIVEKINVNTNEYSIWNYVCFDWIKKWLLIYWPIHGRTRYLVVFKNDHYYERYESVVQPLISLLLQSTAFKLAFRAFKYLAASVIPPCILRIFRTLGFLI